MDRGADDVVIVGAARTPIGKFQGTLRNVAAVTLGGTAIRAALERSRARPDAVAEVLMGNVVQAGLGQAPARQAALAAGLPVTVCATTINKVCGSGLKAVMLAANALRVGEGELYVAGGMENMNQAPYLLANGRFGYRLGNAELVDSVVHDGLWCAIEKQHMGLAAEWIAEHYGITRRQQDEFALQSQRRAQIALNQHAFSSEIEPISVTEGRTTTEMAIDEAPRADSAIEALTRLKPAFKENGTVTAGNAPGITDGAAALVLTRRSVAEAQGLRPLARITGQAQAAVRPLEIFTAPVFALRQLAQRTALSLNDFDLFELNEAFAAQCVANITALGLDPEKVNVNGGAIALGHPIGASGARVLVTLLYALIARGLRRGAVALCLGGGEAVAMSIEIESD
jgi:acetyl-CoA C-acetyltransferase